MIMELRTLTFSLTDENGKSQFIQLNTTKKQQDSLLVTNLNDFLVMIESNLRVDYNDIDDLK